MCVARRLPVQRFACRLGAAVRKLLAAYVLLSAKKLNSPHPYLQGMRWLEAMTVWHDGPSGERMSAQELQGTHAIRWEDDEVCLIAFGPLLLIFCSFSCARAGPDDTCLSQTRGTKVLQPWTEKLSPQSHCVCPVTPRQVACTAPLAAAGSLVGAPEDSAESARCAAACAWASVLKRCAPS